MCDTYIIIISDGVLVEFIESSTRIEFSPVHLNENNGGT